VPVATFALSPVKGMTMKALSCPALLLAFGLLLARPAAAAADAPGAVKSGGNYDVEVLQDITYYTGKDADPVRHKLDLYLPRGVKGYPVLFFIHGGGWSKGSKDGFARHGKLFARNGIAFVAANYRLTPQVQHPAHAQDVARAFAWTHRHIAKYGGRADQIFVSGHSAGGHLVALLATDPSYLEAEKLALIDIKGAIPISGVYTIRAGRIKAFGGDEEACRLASPQSHVSGQRPPELIIYADKDGKDFDKMAESFAEALRKVGNTASTLKVDNRTHNTVMANIANQDDPATQAILAFIARHAGLKLTTP
jgi:acetyl esterase/lipase